MNIRDNRGGKRVSDGRSFKLKWFVNGADKVNIVWEFGLRWNLGGFRGGGYDLLVSFGEYDVTDPGLM